MTDKVTECKRTIAALVSRGTHPDRIADAIEALIDAKLGAQAPNLGAESDQH